MPIINDDQLEEIDKQLERQFRRIDDLKQIQRKNFREDNQSEFPRELINFEERRREQDIEKRIDLLLKKKE